MVKFLPLHRHSQPRPGIQFRHPQLHHQDSLCAGIPEQVRSLRRHPKTSRWCSRMTTAKRLSLPPRKPSKAILTTVSIGLHSPTAPTVSRSFPAQKSSNDTALNDLNYSASLSNHKSLKHSCKNFSQLPSYSVGTNSRSSGSLSISYVITSSLSGNFALSLSYGILRL